MTITGKQPPDPNAPVIASLAGSATCPTDAFGRSQCAELLRKTMDGGVNGMPVCDITVSTARPLIVGPYGVNGYRCPHGVEYFIEPTSEQVVDWAARGVR